MTKKYILFDEKKKKLAESKSIVEIRKKAYNIALNNALKKKVTQSQFSQRYVSEDFTIVEEKNDWVKQYGMKSDLKEIGFVKAYYTKYTQPYFIEKYGKEELDVRYHSLPFFLGKEYYLNKNGSIKEVKW